MTISESTRRDVINLLGIAPDRVCTIYCGVDDSFKPLPEPDVEAFKARRQLPDTFVLFLGTLEPRKNVDGLIKAYAAWKAKAQSTVDNAHMRYFIVHLHRLLEPEMNEAGGVLGNDVVHIEGDSGDTENAVAPKTISTLLAQDVDAIIGAASSSVSLSVIDTVVNAGVVMFSPANTSKAFSDYNDKGLYFRNAPSDILQGSVLADTILQDGYTNVFILALNPMLAALFARHIQRIATHLETVDRVRPRLQRRNVRVF